MSPGIVRVMVPTIPPCLVSMGDPSDAEGYTTVFEIIAVDLVHKVPTSLKKTNVSGIKCSRVDPHVNNTRDPLFMPEWRHSVRPVSFLIALIPLQTQERAGCLQACIRTSKKDFILFQQR